MSALREPVGPKSRGVYVRRRLLVLAGFLAIIAAIVLIVLKPGSSGGAAGPNNVAVPDDLVTVEELDEESTPHPDEIPACATGRLVVTPITDAASYGPEDEPLLSLRIENTGDAECVADLGTAGMLFEITSGSDQIWRSSDCQTEADHRSVVLLPGEPEETEPIPWNRERSSPETCDIDRQRVVAGGASYHLRVTAGGVTSTGTAQFQLY